MPVSGLCAAYKDNGLYKFNVHYPYNAIDFSAYCAAPEYAKCQGTSYWSIILGEGSLLLSACSHSELSERCTASYDSDVNHRRVLIRYIGTILKLRFTNIDLITIHHMYCIRFLHIRLVMKEYTSI